MFDDLVTAVRADTEQRWRTSWTIGKAALGFFLIGNVVIVASMAHRPTFRALTREDSALEWIQFISFVASAVLAFIAAMSLLRRNERLVGWTYMLMGIALVFISGEEISWGQRVLDFDTPTGFAAKNEQNETTLHNLVGVLDVIDIGMLGIALFGVVAPIVALRRRLPPFWSWVSPPAFTPPLFLVMVVYRLSRLTVFTESRLATNRLAEWAETCLAVAILSFMYAARSRSSRRNSAATS